MEDHLLLDKSINKGLDYVTNCQLSNGLWAGDVSVGAQSTALYLVVLKHLGLLSVKQAEHGARFIVKWQLNDGSFENYPNQNEGGVEATCICLAGLVASGVNNVDSELTLATRWFKSNANEKNITPRARMYLALAGISSPKEIFTMPIYAKLWRGLDNFLGKRLQLFVVLASYCQSIIKQGLIDTDTFSNSPNFLKRYLKNEYLEYFQRTQSPNGSWAGVMESTCWAVLALKALGLNEKDLIYKKGIEALLSFRKESLTSFEAITFDANLWNSATLTKVLLMAGRQKDSKNIQNSIKALIDEQAHLPMPKIWQRPTGSMPRSGGWAFESNNPYGQDPDSTAAIMNCLICAKRNGYFVEELGQVLTKGYAWVKGMQNTDGGWPAFTHGYKNVESGPKNVNVSMPPKGLINIIKYTFSPPVLFADPSYPDITGRLLPVICEMLEKPDHHIVSQAQKFLFDQRADNKVWWGHWEVCYVLSTAYIVHGLLVSGVSSKEKVIIDALEWLLSKQNSDGGWGETPEAYFNEYMAGIGPSSEELTGKVVLALIEAGMIEDTAVKKAISWLMARQLPEGNWDSGFAVGVVVPPDALYANPWYSHYCALEALVCYSNHIKDKKH